MRDPYPEDPSAQLGPYVSEGSTVSRMILGSWLLASVPAATS